VLYHKVTNIGTDIGPSSLGEPRKPAVAKIGRIRNPSGIAARSSLGIRDDAKVDLR
jgi:hypothetical protein